MTNYINQTNFEFKRRIDKVIYHFYSCEPIDGQSAWKREDTELWITLVKNFALACIDNKNIICAIPWGIVLNKTSDLPPDGEWVSKKADKSYVYDLYRLPSSRNAVIY